MPRHRADRAEPPHPIPQRSALPARDPGVQVARAARRRVPAGDRARGGVARRRRGDADRPPLAGERHRALSERRRLAARARHPPGHVPYRGHLSRRRCHRHQGPALPRGATRPGAVVRRQPCDDAARPAGTRHGLRRHRGRPVPARHRGQLPAADRRDPQASACVALRQPVHHAAAADAAGAVRLRRRCSRPTTTASSSCSPTTPSRCTTRRSSTSRGPAATMARRHSASPGSTRRRWRRRRSWSRCARRQAGTIRRESAEARASLRACDKPGESARIVETGNVADRGRVSLARSPGLDHPELRGVRGDPRRRTALGVSRRRGVRDTRTLSRAPVRGSAAGPLPRRQPAGLRRGRDRVRLADRRHPERP